MPTKIQKKKQLQCINNFARYEKRNSPTSYTVLQGQIFDKGDSKKYIIDEDGEIIEIPEGYRKVTIKNIEWIKDLFCQIPIDTSQLKALGALDYKKWFDKSRSKWLKISDIKRLTPGEKITLVVLHRNTEDLSLDKSINSRGKAIKPSTFYRKMIAYYRPDALSSGMSGMSGMSGSLRFKSINEKEWPLELEVEYKPGFWYPLVNGYLPAKDPQNIFGVLLGRKIHWKDLPSNTPVGWRGPMILLEDVKKMPLVYYS